MTELKQDGHMFVLEGELLCEYRGPGGAVQIPENVRYIGSQVFNGNEKITAVRFPERTEYLPERLFENCTALEEVSLPQGAFLVPYFAFHGCVSLKTVEIPSSCTAIEERAFAGCTSLRSIRLPKALTSLQAGAFEDCSALEEISIPDGIAELAEDTFSGCTALASVQIPETMVKLGARAFLGCASLTEFPFPAGLRSIQEQCFQGTGLVRVSLPQGIREVGSRAFRHSRLREAYVPGTVKDLYVSAFWDCPGVFVQWMAGDMELPWNVRWMLVDTGTRITADMVLDAPYFPLFCASPEVKVPLCRGFARRYLSGNVKGSWNTDEFLTYIRRRRKEFWKIPEIFPLILMEGMFNASETADCLDQAAKMGDVSVTAALMDYAQQHFPAGKLQKIQENRLQRELRWMESGKTSLTELRKAWSWKPLEGGGVYICSWKGTEGTTVIVPAEIGGEKVLGIGEQAFSCDKPRLRPEQREARKKLEEIFLPDTLEWIGNKAFTGCHSLQSIQLPKTLTSLGSNAFASCFRLREVSIPGGVEAVRFATFYRCRSLERLVLEEGVKKVEHRAITQCGNLASLTVPASLEEFLETSIMESAKPSVLMPRETPELRALLERAGLL